MMMMMMIITIMMMTMTMRKMRDTGSSKGVPQAQRSNTDCDPKHKLGGLKVAIQIALPNPQCTAFGPGL